MTPFEYLSVLISIILGLGLTELLSNVRGLIARDRQTQWHWLPLTWAVLVFVAIVQWWWAAFGLSGRVEWHFFSFLLILMAPVLQYLAAAVVLPETQKGESVDLRDWYFDHHRLLFSILATMTLVEFLRSLIAADVQAMALNGAVAILLGSLALVKKPVYHLIGTIAAAGLLGSFIVLETLRIG